MVGSPESAYPGPVGDLVLIHPMDENFQIEPQDVVA